jgi:hypothetical protein
MNALPIVLLILQSLAFGKSLPWSMLPEGIARLLWLVATAGLLVWMFRAHLLRPLRPCPDAIVKIAGHRIFLISWFALGLVYLAFSYFRFRGFGYGVPYLHLLVFAIALPFLRVDRLGVSFAASIGLLIASIVHFPLHPDRSDMIPVIQSGLDRWWEGSDPYVWFELSGRQNLMGYLPGTFLSHLPAWALGIDLRWNEVLYRALWMSLAWQAVRAKVPKSESKSETQPAIVALHLFALSPYLGFRHDLYFEAFWLLLAVFVLRPSWRWLVLPMLVVTRQWAWVLAPFLLIPEIIRARGAKGGRLNAKELGRFAVGFTLVIGTTVALFGRTTSVESFTHAIFWFQKLLTREGFTGDYGISLSPAFFSLGITAVMQKAQVAVCLALLVWAWRSGANKTAGEHEWKIQWAKAALYAWIGFLVLNMHFWLYFWFSPAFFALLLAMRLKSTTRATLRP